MKMEQGISNIGAISFINLVFLVCILASSKDFDMINHVANNGNLETIKLDISGF